MAKWNYTWSNIISGILIYAVGDTVASFIAGEFSICRMLGLAFVGGTVYALEIPNWFLLIDKWTHRRRKDLKTGVLRMVLALAYFNPLWIARHMLFINFFAGNFQDIGWRLLPIGAVSFAVNIPIAIVGNYLIQNRLVYKWRFLANCVFSAVMAVYFALSEIWFG